MSPPTITTPPGKSGRLLIGRASSAAGISGLAALTTVTDERGVKALLAVAVAVLALHLVIAATLTFVAGRIALLAVKGGQDPIRIIQVLISFLRATG